jgi:hypothetical protein
MAKYLLLHTKARDGACRVRTIQHVPESERLKTGVSYAADFPEAAAFEMNETFPKDIRLVDAIENQSSVLLVSERFKQVLESIPGSLLQNEILPVQIINHRGRPEKAPYYIIHQLDYPACLDEDQTTGERSSLAPEMFQFLETMVLDESRIPPELMLFRPAQYPRMPLVRVDLAEALTRADLTGFKFWDPATYEF